MLEDLPEDIRAGLRQAAQRQGRARVRFRIRVGGHELPVLRLWGEGFAVGREHGRALRGLVDLYDGARHVAQCLIVASSPEGDEVICEYKRATATADRAARDFAVDDGAPAGLLPSR